MNKINLILNNEGFKKSLIKINQYEVEREFCCHDLEHLLSVARIMVIINSKQNLGLSNEMVYAAALLHDIGRSKQYESGKAHALASKEIAEDILKETGFQDSDRKCILGAIEEHNSMPETILGRLLKDADRLSRNCFNCKAIDKCNWPDEKKNMEITI